MVHLPVMLNEVLDCCGDERVYIDATFGAGGHTKAILENFSNSHVIGLDRDPSVIPLAEGVKKIYGKRFQFFNKKFSEIESILSELKIESLDGVLFDVGVSSMQLDMVDRGFSFNKAGPLTMQMGHNDISAHDIVNSYSEEAIANILSKYGEEKSARKIARAICARREEKPIETTTQLADIISSVKPRRGKIHPATLTFQGLRVYVNDELNELEKALESAIKHLAVNGRVIVITFQGLEDIVTKGVFKRFLRKEKVNKYAVQDASVKIFQKMHGGVIKPSFEEQKMNNRSRSAKMRGIVRVV